VVAGILHDTIEDSVEQKKVSKAMIIERFGNSVADLVESVLRTDYAREFDDLVDSQIDFTV
jgi:(p)ppGpp synthase/HD superfamily hydrolase